MAFDYPVSVQLESQPVSPGQRTDAEAVSIDAAGALIATKAYAAVYKKTGNRLSALALLSMTIDFMAVSCMAPLIVIGGPSISDTVASTTGVATVLSFAPFLAAALSRPTNLKITCLTSLITRVFLCGTVAYCLNHANFSARDILCAMTLLWCSRLVGNDSVLRLAAAAYSKMELNKLAVFSVVGPIVVSGFWLLWLNSPLNNLNPATVMNLCACGYALVAIVFLFSKEPRRLTAAWLGATPYTVSEGNQKSAAVPQTEKAWKFPLVLLQIAVTLFATVPFCLALSENYFPPPHPLLHRDLVILVAAATIAGIGAWLAGVQSRRGSKAGEIVGSPPAATESGALLLQPHYLILIAALELAAIILFPSRSFAPLVLGSTAATACILLIVIERERLLRLNENKWITAVIRAMTLAALYSTVVYMAFQQPVVATSNQWRTLAVICETTILISLLVWPQARAALVSMLSHFVQPIHSKNELGTTGTARIYFTDTLSFLRAAMAAAQLQSTLVVVTSDGFLNLKLSKLVLQYFGIKIANPETPAFLQFVNNFNRVNSAGTDGFDIVVHWARTTYGFFERNTQIIDACATGVELSRLSLSASRRKWQPWLKSVAISAIVTVTKPVRGGAD